MNPEGPNFKPTPEEPWQTVPEHKAEAFLRNARGDRNLGIEPQPFDAVCRCGQHRNVVHVGESMPGAPIRKTYLCPICDAPDTGSTDLLQ